jgi:thiamine biosynthesis lipoprotein
MYDFRQKVKPDEQTLLRALPAVDYHHVLVNDGNRTVRFRHPKVRIDLGGIAKGYAAERSVEILRRRGIEHALVSAGGDTRILGDRRGRSWNVGVRDPRQEGRVIAMLPLVDEAISTSGDYERYFEEDGIRYHHIIKPTTGKPADSVRSVTVIGPDATSTDALSTSLFVLGIRKGLTLVESLQEYEAVFVDHYGDLFYSDGFARLP